MKQKKISKTEFWKILKNSKGFVLDSTGAIRRMTNNIFVCPVSHVGNRVLKKIQFQYSVDLVADVIGIDRKYLWEVAHAADGRKNPMREKLLKTLKIEEN